MSPCSLTLPPRTGADPIGFSPQNSVVNLLTKKPIAYSPPLPVVLSRSESFHLGAPKRIAPPGGHLFPFRLHFLYAHFLATVSLYDSLPFLSSLNSPPVLIVRHESLGERGAIPVFSLLKIHLLMKSCPSPISPSSGVVFALDPPLRSGYVEESSRLLEVCALPALCSPPYPLPLQLS